MLVTTPYNYASTIVNQAGKSSVFVPTVYEKESQPLLRWEYHVLVADAQEMALPDAGQLNALGREGWILVGLLDERATGQGSQVYYYFTRQVYE